MINFLRYKYVCLAASTLVVFVGIAFFAYNRMHYGTGFRYDIDFSGGTELALSFDQGVHIERLRTVVAPLGYTLQSLGGADAQGNHKEFLARTAVTLEQSADVAESLVHSVQQAIPDNEVTLQGSSSVGAEVGRDIQWNSFLALTLSLLFILLYIALRSQPSYAIGAVVAILHDLLLLLIALIIIGEQISVNVLAAILAVLGYSLNDTIVIFSRIRENVASMGSTPLEEIVNLSINQTLRRTLLTSFATLLSVVALFVLGGEVLHGFALTMMIGIVIGTFSSIYIASPVMIACSGLDRLTLRARKQK